MKNLVLINKELGKTPLDSINLLREKYPEYKDSKLAYAGRLDPMAQGLLLVLIDDECKKRDEYQNLKKTYKFEFFFGVGTDTFDLLGLINSKNEKIIKIDKVESILKSFIGKIRQEYPIYSSYNVKGKPLYWWARNNKLSEIQIPSKEVTVFNISGLSERKISKEELEESIISRINLVVGDFRQNEIVQAWKDFFSKSNLEFYTIFQLTSEVGSGTYVRALVKDIGIALDSCATTYSIERTKIGDFTIEESLQL